MELDYDKLFKTSIRAMTLSGTHPFKQRNIKWFIHVLYLILHETSIFLFLAYNIIFIDLKNNDYIKAGSNGVISVLSVFIVYQILILIVKREFLRNLINAMKKDYELTKLLPRSEQIIVLDYAKKGEWVYKQWVYIITFSCFVFPLRNFYYIFRSWLNGKIQWQPMYDVSFGIKIIDDNLDNFGMYIATFVYMNFSSYVASVTYLSSFPMGPNFLIHACGQLELVKRRIDVLFDCDDVDVIKERLNCIVKHMQYIYSFLNQTEQAFMESYELTLKLDAILLPVTLYEIIECMKQGTPNIEFVSFLFGGIVISYLPCYYSELLMEKGEEVRQAMYSSGWEKIYDRSIRSTMRLFLLRSLRPIAIRTMFRTVCLDALADLLHQSYAIFNFMTAAL